MFWGEVMNLWHSSVEPSIDRRSTDHRNLIYVFDPVLRYNDFKKQAVDKLCRWSSKLFAYKNVIEHIPGESQYMGRLLVEMKAYWGAESQKTKRECLAMEWSQCFGN